MALTDQAILDYITDHPGAGPADIRRHVAPEVRGSTLSRALKNLVDAGWLEASGEARATGRNLAGPAVVRAYRVLRADVKMPNKAALAYRDFVRRAVRRCVLEWGAFRPGNVMAMATEADIPEADRAQVVAYVGRQFRGLHEGNIIRYRLRPEDLTGIEQG